MLIMKAILVVSFFAIVTSTLTVQERLQRNNATCGVSKVSTGLIVLGQSFSRGDFPWIVALTYMKVHPSIFFCAGTIISSKYVISAAHCISQKHSLEKLLPRDILAFFGAHDLRNHLEAGRYSLSPKKLILHDDWNPMTTQFDGDISLLEFETGSILFNDYVQPICLVESERAQTATEGIVPGWGKSENPSRNHENIPKLVKVSILNNAQCLPGEDTLASISSHRTFCAGLRNGSGVCSGDSGGGLFIKVDDSYALKGIVSSSLFKDENCVVTKSAVYTNVSEFMVWILKKTGIRSKVSAVNSRPQQPSTHAAREASCTTITKVYNWSERDHNFKTCNADINEVDSEDFTISSETDSTIMAFNIQDKQGVKFLPTNLLRTFLNLKVIRVWECAVISVKYHFRGLSQLISLILALNQIEHVSSDAFVDLVSLQHLDLGFNKIQFLGENTFESLTALKNLYLHENRIQVLPPKTFVSLVKLQHIALYKNHIEHVSSVAFAGLVNLEFIDLGFNKIQFLGENTFESLTALKKLFLHNNEVQFLNPKAFGSLAKIEHITLNHNRISALAENVFENSSSFKIIHLNGNQLERIPKDLFKNNLNLEEVWLSGNKITYIDANMFDNLQSLKFVELKDNICIDGIYNEHNFMLMRNDLKQNCNKQL